MKTDPKTILATLASLAPSIAFRTDWDQDPAPDFDIFDEGNGLSDERPADWACWQSDTSATAIVNGKTLTGHAYLGGHWERYGDDPAESDPDVSGYLPQKLEEALDELDDQTVNEPLVAQIHAAKRYLQTVMRHRYEEQRRAARA